MKKLLIFLAASTWGYASAQTQGSSTTSGTTATSAVNSGTQTQQSSDQNFIRQAAMIDVMEIEAGKLASQKAIHSEVKSYGQMMVNDHTASSQQLKAIASRKGITIPDHASLHGTQNQGASNSAMMGSTGTGSTLGTRYYSDIQVTQGNEDSWRAYNPKNTTRSTGGSETYWTPNFRGKKGISTRNAGSSSNRSMSSIGAYGSMNENTSVEQDSHMNHDANRSISTSGNANTAAGTSGTYSNTNTGSTGSYNNSSNSMNANTSGTIDSGISGSSTTNMDGTSARTTTNERSANSINGSVSSGDLPETGSSATSGSTTASGTTGTTNGSNSWGTTGNASTSGTSGSSTGNMDGTSARTTTNERSANSINGSVSSGDLPDTGTGTSTNSSMSASGQSSFWPSQMELDEHNGKLNRLRGLTGKNFDEEYLQMMAKDHHNAIRLFEQASTSSDTEIRDFANKMLTKLRAHQTSAKTLLDKLDSQL